MGERLRHPPTSKQSIKIQLWKKYSDPFQVKVLLLHCGYTALQVKVLL